MNQSQDKSEQTGAVVARELGELIAASGKMRMLSHQALMLGLQGPDEPDRQARCAAALREFDDIAARLLAPAGKCTLCPDARQAMEAVGAVSDSAKLAIKRFQTEAAILLLDARAERPPKSALDRLADCVSGDLLRELNSVVSGIQAALSHHDRAMRREREDLVATVHQTLGEIDRLSKTLHVVSINASIEAQRFGDDGQSFAVLAGQMRALAQTSGDQAQSLVIRLRDALP